MYVCMSTQCPYDKMFYRNWLCIKIDSKNREMANGLMCICYIAHCNLHSKVMSFATLQNDQSGRLGLQILLRYAHKHTLYPSDHSDTAGVL